MVEFFDGLEGIFLGNGAGVMDGVVADGFDQFGFVKEGLGDEVLKGWLVKEGAEFIVVGHVQ